MTPPIDPDGYNDTCRYHQTTTVATTSKITASGLDKKSEFLQI